MNQLCEKVTDVQKREEGERDIERERQSYYVRHKIDVHVDTLLVSVQTFTHFK